MKTSMCASALGHPYTVCRLRFKSGPIQRLKGFALKPAFSQVSNQQPRYAMETSDQFDSSLDIAVPDTCLTHYVHTSVASAVEAAVAATTVPYELQTPRRRRRAAKPEQAWIPRPPSCTSGPGTTAAGVRQPNIAPTICMKYQRSVACVLMKCKQRATAWPSIRRAAWK